MQLLATDPSAVVKAPNIERSELATLSEADVALLLEACGDSELRRIVFVAVQTALRISEILGLKWSDINFDAGRASIACAVKYTDGEHVLRTPKSGHGQRAVALGSGTVAALREQRQHQAEHRLRTGPAYADQGLIFAGPLDDIRSMGSTRNAFKRAARQVGFPDLRFHDLRHTSATLALKAGVHPKIVSERLGHANVAITMNVYSHVLPDMQRDAADALDKLVRLPEQREA